jgi:hypothetical protein
LPWYGAIESAPNLSKPKKQHFIPQFLLKNFARGKKSKAKLWTFDKATGSDLGVLNRPKTNNVACIAPSPSAWWRNCYNLILIFHGLIHGIAKLQGLVRAEISIREMEI